MKQTRVLMGMPITVEIIDAKANDATFEKVFEYFQGHPEKIEGKEDKKEGQ